MKIVVHINRRMNGVKLDLLRFEPIAHFFHMVFIVIVEVSARGKNLQRLRAAADHRVQQARMQPPLDIDVTRHCAQHQ